jgi:hypothetical protein
MQAGGYIMQVKTKVKAGALHYNHNQTLVRDRVPRQPLKVKTHVKAGRIQLNHNQTLVRDQAKRK